MPKTTSPDLSTRKKMRKGTHSCFECRRRKIRCIFPPENPDVCSECFARGSKCIDQENANPDIVVDHRKNLRERVSRLEALLDNLLEERGSDKSTTIETSSTKTPTTAPRDTFPPTPLSSEGSSILPIASGNIAASERGHHVPILSVLEDALNNAEEQLIARSRAGGSVPDNVPLPPDASLERYTVVIKHPEDIEESNVSKAHLAKKERAKKGLISVLPPYEQLTKILNSNDEWWSTWRKKCSGTSGNKTLSQFASSAIAEGNIGHLGTLALSVGICSDSEDIEKYIDAVDRWVLADDEYAATLEGMECLILKAKWYADVGQPRRAWLAYRKGLMFSQLMGLHRKRTNSAAHESIWWSLYHGDRFLSLLLGLPYGVSDAHCDLTIPETTGPYLSPLIFMNKISILAGKVIDRNQSQAEQSFAWALQLDQELEDLWKRLDPNWVDTTGLMVDVVNNAADLRERLMAQMIYHQIRVYLHLPFMLKSAANQRFTYSRTACLKGSREVLKGYQSLRAGDVEPLYECKAVDFIGFTAAVLILLGLFNFGAQQGNRDSAKEREEDIRLVEISVDIFRRASSEKGGKVALQSAEVLEKMLRKFKGAANGGGEDCDKMSDFVIPYFGKISIRRGGKPSPGPYCPGGTFQNTLRSPSMASSAQYTPSSETSSDNLFGTNLSSTTSHSQDSFKFNNDPFVSYDGMYNMNNNNAMDTGAGLNNQLNDDSMNNFPLPTHNFSWQNMPMDIDQDWSWFLNDNQAMMQTQTTDDGQFTQNNYQIGF